MLDRGTASLLREFFLRLKVANSGEVIVKHFDRRTGEEYFTKIVQLVAHVSHMYAIK